MEWNPEIAPHATVMNIKDHIGVPFGCMFLKLFHPEVLVYVYVFPFGTFKIALLYVLRSNASEFIEEGAVILE